MKCQAAVLRGVGKDWEISEIDVDPHRDGEVLVRMAVAGYAIPTRGSPGAPRAYGFGVVRHPPAAAEHGLAAPQGIDGRRLGDVTRRGHEPAVTNRVPARRRSSQTLVPRS